MAILGLNRLSVDTVQIRADYETFYMLRTPSSGNCCGAKVEEGPV